MPLSSRPEQDASLAISQWRAAGLLKPSWVKPIIGTVTTRLVEKRLGKLVTTDEQCVKAGLAILLESRWTKT